jgi:hypothetical protein
MKILKQLVLIAVLVGGQSLMAMAPELNKKEQIEQKISDAIPEIKDINEQIEEIVVQKGDAKTMGRKGDLPRLREQEEALKQKRKDIFTKIMGNIITTNPNLNDNYYKNFEGFETLLQEALNKIGEADQLRARINARKRAREKEEMQEEMRTISPVIVEEVVKDYMPAPETSTVQLIAKKKETEVAIKSKIFTRKQAAQSLSGMTVAALMEILQAINTDFRTYLGYVVKLNITEKPVLLQALITQAKEFFIGFKNANQNFSKNTDVVAQLQQAEDLISSMEATLKTYFK